MTNSALLRRTGGAAAYSRQIGDGLRQWLGDREQSAATIHASEPLPWSDSIDRLLRIRTLEDDWDGEGTEAPNPALVDRAISLAQLLQGQSAPQPDRVHASVNSTVYFEWNTPFGYCELEVISPLEAEFRKVPAGSSDTEVIRLTDCF